MRSFFALLILFLIPGPAVSQDNREQRRDSLYRQLMDDSAYIYRKTIARPYLRLENRRSFIAAEKVNFLGFLAGVTLYDRHIVCAGYYFLDNKSRGLITLEPQLLSQQFSRLNYYNFSYQYILLNYRYLQLNTPIEAGYGDYRAKVIHHTGAGDSALAGNFIPFGAGLQLILKPLRWVGFSASGGYRYVKHDAIRLSFNGWYYSVGVWIDARYLFRATRYHYAKKRYHRTVRKLD